MLWPMNGNTVSAQGSAWARSRPNSPFGAALRESQTAALALSGTGQAVAIDVEEADNTHPWDKQTVGQRLALVARPVAYGQKVEDSGPGPLSATTRCGMAV